VTVGSTTEEHNVERRNGGKSNWMSKQIVTECRGSGIITPEIRIPEVRD